MSDYFIGDLQGCFDGLEKALAIVEFNPSKDNIWLTGDLIARGPHSLATIKYIYKNQDHIKTVLGNHDLHFLAVANKIKKANPKDLLSDLLNSKKLPTYLDWLRQQPLILPLPNAEGYMTHAGLAPHWSPKKAVKWGQRVSEQLTKPSYKKFLPTMYGNKPAIWHKSLSEQDKLKYSVSAFTRMRFCHGNGALEFTHKQAPKSLTKLAKSKLTPWFMFEPQRFEQTKWVFGHWASLMGQVDNPNIHALDTGYVWGNYLTILNWQTGEKFKVI